MNRRTFEIWMALEYVRLIKLSVDKQRYKSKWAPLSLAYLQYKRDNNLSLKTWEATGELIKNLKFKRTTMSIGFDEGRVHSDSEESLLKIARTLEYGDLQVPARPLFRQVYWYMSKNIRFFYKKFLKEIIK